MLNRKYKNYLIYPKFQLTLLLANLIISTITLVIIKYKVEATFNHLIELGSKIKLPLDHPYFEFISMAKNIMTSNLNWAFGLSIFFSAIASIYISHKIVGPIYNLKVFFLSLKNGEKVKELKFRKGDFYTDIPPIINEVLSHLTKSDVK